MSKVINEADMPAPDDVVKYKNGQTGLAMFHYGHEDMNYQTVADAHGFATKFLHLDDDDNPDAIELQKRYEAGADSFEISNAWKPVPPHGWTLGEIYDTEDGLIALCIKPKEDIDAKTGTADDQGLFALDDRSGPIDQIGDEGSGP